MSWYKEINDDVKKTGRTMWWIIVAVFALIIFLFAFSADAHQSTHCISICNPGTNICTLQCY